MAFTEKYVTTTGAGAHDGTSEANAWSFAEMIAATPAAETRVNVKAGSYSEGTTTLPANGTVSAPIVLRGYSSTIGDLDNLGRGSDGTLTTTNMPDITITGLWTSSPYCTLQNLDITGALSSALIGSSANDRLGMVNCRVVNTQNNAAARCFQGDNQIDLVNCDFHCSGASHTSVVDFDDFCFVSCCRFTGTLNTASLVTIGGTNSFVNCVFIGMGNTSKGIEGTGTETRNLYNHCTFYNCGTAIQSINAVSSGASLVTNCHITDCAKYLDNLYAATSNHIVIEMGNRTRDNTTPRTGILAYVLGSEVTTDAGDYTTDYVSATNVRLIATAAGANAGLVPYNDIGAARHADPAGGGGGGPLVGSSALISV